MNITFQGSRYGMEEESPRIYTYNTADSPYGPVLPEGIYRYYLTASGEGLEKNSPEYTFIVDRLPPVINITSPHEGEEFSYDDITLKYNASEPLSKVEYDVDCIGSPIASGEEITVYDLEKGNRTITITAWDLAGNTGSASVNFSILNDTTPPGINLTGARSYYNTTNVTLHVYINEIVSGSTYALDSGNATEATGLSYGARSTEYEITSRDLSEGIHYIRINATDQDNNTGLYEGNFTVDLTPPEISTGYPDTYSTANRSISICYSASDINRIENCIFQSNALGDEPAGFGSQEASYCVNRTAGSGNYSWNVSCTDAAGNTQVTGTKTFENIINVSAGYGEPTPEDNTTTGSTTQTIAVYADWNITGCVMNWNGASYNMSNSGTGCAQTIENMSDGTYAYNATVYSDIYIIYLETRRLTVYTVPPEVTITQPAQGAVYTSGQSTSHIPWIRKPSGLNTCWTVEDTLRQTETSHYTASATETTS